MRLYYGVCIRCSIYCPCLIQARNTQKKKTQDLKFADYTNLVALICWFLQLKAFYSSKSWATYRHYLRGVLPAMPSQQPQYCRSKFVTNIKVFAGTKITNIEDMPLISRLRWVGHVCRMGKYYLPKTKLKNELFTGHRDWRLPKKLQKDSFKVFCWLSHQPSTMVQSRW